MNTAKKFLNIAIGISIIVCSVSLLVFSIKGNTAMAQAKVKDGYMISGVVSGFDDYVYVIGYETRSRDVQVLGKISKKEVGESK